MLLEISPANLPVLRRAEALRCPNLAVHEKKVGEVCQILCKKLGVEPELADLMTIAAQSHDLGQLAIGDDLLKKTAPLSADEMMAMREHVHFGHDMLAGTGLQELELAASVALNHHENFDGTGYPRGLKGRAIPMASRIVALCDVYDSLRESNFYHRGLGHADAMAILTHGDRRTRPSHFDPRFLAAFCECGEAIAQLYEQSCSAAPNGHDDPIKPHGAPPFQRSTGRCTKCVLSVREAEVLELVARGFSNKLIARHLEIGIRSVETYRARGAAKLGLKTRADVVRYGIGAGWLSA